MKVAYVGIDLMLPALETLGSQEEIEILKIFTCPNLYEGETSDGVVAFAKSHGIPYTKEKVKEADLAALREAGCELLLCAGYYYRLPITDAFPMINIHPAPLPSHRGAWPMPYILLWGEAEGAVTFHKMEESFDQGEILFSRSFPLSAQDNLMTYMQKANALLPSLVKDLIRNLPKHLSAARPQGQGRYLKNPTEADWTVTDQMSVKEADKILRAFYGYPVLYLSASAKKEISFGKAEYGPPKEGEFPLLDGKIVF